MTVISLLFLGILGAILGSFASALIPRIREKRNMSHERSECPKCHHTLGVLDLFPIFSYILLLGKCRYCKAKIPPYHFLLECAMTLSFVVVGYIFGDWSSINNGDLSALGTLGLLLFAMFVTIVFCTYDLLYMEIPDEVLLPSLFFLFALLIASQFGYIDTFSYFKPFEDSVYSSPLVNAFLGVLPIFGFFLLQILVSNGAWLGGGDLRIAVFMGFIGGAKIAWLGLFLSYLVGSIIGIVLLAIYRRRNIAIPFGPYLAIGLWLSFAYYTPIVEWYFGFLGA